MDSWNSEFHGTIPRCQVRGVGQLQTQLMKDYRNHGISSFRIIMDPVCHLVNHNLAVATSLIFHLTSSSKYLTLCLPTSNDEELRTSVSILFCRSTLGYTEERCVHCYIRDSWWQQTQQLKRKGLQGKALLIQVVAHEKMANTVTSAVWTTQLEFVTCCFLLLSLSLLLFYPSSSLFFFFFGLLWCVEGFSFQYSWYDIGFQWLRIGRNQS